MKGKLSPPQKSLQMSIGTTLLNGHYPKEALPYLVRECEDNPKDSTVHNNLGACLSILSEFESAHHHLQASIALNPANHYPVYNMAMLTEAQGKFAEAEEWYRQTLVMNPQDHGAKQGYAQSLMRRGEWGKALEMFEDYRWWKAPLPVIEPWTGQSLTEKRILVLYEGGHGDVFNFMRYLLLLKEDGAHVTLFGMPAQRTLLEGHPWIDRYLDHNSELDSDEFDYQVSLWSIISLTKIFPLGMTEPYIKVAPARLACKDAAPADALTVGLCLEAGELGTPGRQIRNIPHQDARALLETGMHFVSLQLGPMPGWVDERPDTSDWKKTAAVIAACDLVVTSDTAVAHLAGAMGKVTWVILPVLSEWRWLIGREDSPWYPTMQLFRNKDTHGFGEIMREVAKELTYLAKGELATA